MKEEDYKFVYKISCEPKISPSQDITTITQKIIATRVKMVDEMTIKLLKEIAEEKGYSEILAIDESKVTNFVKELKALEIIKEKRVNLDLLYECFEYNDWEHYNNFQPNFWTPITQEEYDLLKEVLL